MNRNNKYFEVAVAKFLDSLSAKGVEKLALAEALRHLAFEAEQDAEKEGIFR